ncbi:hypothetical protein HOY82DRAFT_353785 [Tuber indicum]|nr:hypothetical protein HOY82DRAFT_353785 [Tuber indicum]
MTFTVKYNTYASHSFPFFSFLLHTPSYYFTTPLSHTSSILFSSFFFFCCKCSLPSYCLVHLLRFTPGTVAAFIFFCCFILPRISHFFRFGIVYRYLTTPYMFALSFSLNLVTFLHIFLSLAYINMYISRAEVVVRGDGCGQRWL